jgi:hypothetical protein
MHAIRSAHFRILAAIFSSAALPVMSSADIDPGYQLTFSSISSGGQNMADGCYRLSGTVSQPMIAPGIFTTDNYTEFSGFWSAAPIAMRDELFFNGFEGCSL